jgi:hypothetical protein
LASSKSQPSEHPGPRHGQGLGAYILDCSSYDSSGGFAGFTTDAARRIETAPISETTGQYLLQQRWDLGGLGPGQSPPLSQLSHRCGDCVERIIRLIGVANYGESDSVNGVLESRPREWREIDHVPPMSYGRARAFKKKHDLGSARCIEIIGDRPYVE